MNLSPKDPASKPGSTPTARPVAGKSAKPELSALRRLSRPEADELLAVLFQLHARMDQLEQGRGCGSEPALRRTSAQSQELAAEPVRLVARLRKIAFTHTTGATAEALHETADLFEAVVDRLLWLEAACNVLLDERGLCIDPPHGEVPL